MKRLQDLEAPTLALIAEVLDAHCAPIGTPGPDQMSSEESRGRLMYEAGRRSVVDDVNNLLRIARAKVK